MTDTKKMTAYLAHRDFIKEVLHETGKPMAVYERLILIKGEEKPSIWAQNIWKNPEFIDISSIKDGAKKLRNIQRNWWNYSFDNHRRSALIQENLPHISAKPIQFPNPAPTAPLGSWTLIEPNLILASPDCSSIFPNGELNFEEDRKTSPTRAYLKLWDVFTRTGIYPKKGQKCIDLGSCPGGWSWVLQQLGCKVISVDKAPLEPRIAKLPNIEFRKESAFGLNPQDIGTVDWVFSDIICYPERLLRLVNNWIESGLTNNMICTIKFQKETDYKITQEFLNIPGSRIMHLYHNKHELTWIWSRKDA